MPETLFDLIRDAAQRTPKFGGVTFDPQMDGPRLNRQLEKVQAFMADGAWRTLAEIEQGTGFPQASISARLRDCRKPAFGGATVERRRRSAGTWEYRLLTQGGS